MRILISNDDGIDSPGICALEAAARHFTDDLWIVAPDNNRSAASRAITIKQPVKVTPMGSRKFAVHGTPTDCVLIAMHKLITDKKPDLVLSGINVGSNLATDIGYSGTVAVAIESALQGITAIAFSQTYEKEHDNQVTIDWQQSSETATQVVQRLLPVIQELRPIAFNVNLPTHPIGMRITHHAAMIPTVSIACDTHNNHWVLGGAMSAMRVYSQITKDREPNPEEDFHPQSFEGILLNYLKNNPDVKIESTSDLVAIIEQHVSITPLAIDFNNRDVIQKLSSHFNSINCN